MPVSKPAETLIFQLNLTLQESKPPIWRRIQVKRSITLAKLHHILQLVMGWTDSHLHQFMVNGVYYGIGICRRGPTQQFAIPGKIVHAACDTPKLPCENEPRKRLINRASPTEMLEILPGKDHIASTMAPGHLHNFWSYTKHLSLSSCLLLCKKYTAISLHSSPAEAG